MHLHFQSLGYICGLYYKLMMIVSDDCRVINKLEASLTDDNRYMFIVQTTGNGQFARILHLTNSHKSQSGLSKALKKLICKYIKLVLVLSFLPLALLARGFSIMILLFGYVELDLPTPVSHSPSPGNPPCSCTAYSAPKVCLQAYKN